MPGDMFRRGLHTARMFFERRRHRRERLALPIEVAGRIGVTRDISIGGLFVALDGEHALQGGVEFELQLAGFAMSFTASGQIVRVEHDPGTTGIAVRLIAPRLTPVEFVR
jgi:hypothetical protein